jgi:hypothetical protein
MFVLFETATSKRSKERSHNHKTQRINNEKVQPYTKPHYHKNQNNLIRNHVITKTRTISYETTLSQKPEQSHTKSRYHKSQNNLIRTHVITKARTILIRNHVSLKEQYLKTKFSSTVISKISFIHFQLTLAPKNQLP